MDISGINAIGSTYATNTSTTAKQTGADFNSLAQALQSGNLAAAQQAFATLQQDSPRVSQAVSASGSGASGSGSTVASALQTLSKDLQAGDVGGAQQAFAALQQAMQTGHHGHHHASSGTSTSTTTPSSQPSASAGNNVNTVA